MREGYSSANPKQIMGEGGGGDTLLLFFRSATCLESRASPKKAGGTPTLFFPDLKIFASIFQTHSSGTHRTSQTSMTSKQKKKSATPERAHMKKGSSFQLIIIQSPNRGGGGGGHLILCPPPSKSWGGGGHVPLSLPPPRICAHGEG